MEKFSISPCVNRARERDGNIGLENTEKLSRFFFFNFSTIVSPLSPQFLRELYKFRHAIQEREVLSRLGLSRPADLSPPPRLRLR